MPGDDLYQLAQLAKPGPHTLDLSVRPGTSLYSFTFGQARSRRAAQAGSRPRALR